MKKGLISIILPVYKVEQYMDKCLESLVNQTYKNLEIILVDDGSPDGSGSKCDEWAKKDKRIKVIHKENGGVSSARNLGLEKATGEYIGFIDPDDIVDCTMYEKLYNKSQDTAADITMCWFNYDYNNGNVIPNHEINLVNATYKNFAYYSILNYSKIKNGIKYTENILGAIWRTLFKKSILDGVEFLPLKVGEDVAFYWLLLKNKPTFACVQECLYNYVIRENSAMTTISIKALDNRIEFALSLNKLLSGFLSEDKIRAFEYQHYKNCMSFVIAKRDKKVLAYVNQHKMFNKLNSRINYKMAQKNSKGFKNKLINFLMHHKMFVIYRMLRKIAGK